MRVEIEIEIDIELEAEPAGALFPRLLRRRVWRGVLRGGLSHIDRLGGYNIRVENAKEFEEIRTGDVGHLHIYAEGRIDERGSSRVEVEANVHSGDVKAREFLRRSGGGRRRRRRVECIILADSGDSSRRDDRWWERASSTSGSEGVLFPRSAHGLLRRVVADDALLHAASTSTRLL